MLIDAIMRLAAETIINPSADVRPTFSREELHRLGDQIKGNADVRFS